MTNYGIKTTNYGIKTTNYGIKPHGEDDALLRDLHRRTAQRLYNLKLLTRSLEV